MEERNLASDTTGFVSLPKKEEKESKNRLKFTEFILILSAVGVIVFLLLLVVNPNKEAAEARNMKRSADISTILAYMSSYAKQQESVPNEIPNSELCVNFTHEICKTGPYDCTDFVNMSFLSEGNDEKLVIMPNDPLYVSLNGTGYFISHNGQGQITVCAPHAERNQKISFSKYIY